MKTVLIKKLSLNNWRGQSRDVDFVSNSVIIKGRNQSGKSTILNAVLWAFLGTDAEDRVNYQLFDNTVEQTHENSRIAKVSLILDIDGIEYTLTKTAQMGWTRKRGHSEYERKGTDNYKFYIDDVEKNATEYKRFVESFAPVEHLKLMLNLSYYQKLDWKVMRKHLETLSGEIKDEDFTSDYSSIQDLLLKFNKDAALMKDSLRPKIKLLRDNIGTESKLGNLIVSIDTLKSNLPDISNLDEIEGLITDAKHQIEMIDNAIANKSEAHKEQMDKFQKVSKQIVDLSNSLLCDTEEYNKANANKVHEIEKKICDIRNQNYSIKRENDLGKENLMELKEKAQNIKYIISNCEKKHKELVKASNDCKAMKFDGGNCPYCGQPLPQDKMEEAIENFNKEKENIHLNIVSEGKHNRETWNTALKRLEEIESEISDFKGPKELISTSELDSELADLKASFIPYEQTREYLDKKTEIDQLKVQLSDMKVATDNTLLETKKNLIRKIEDYSKRLGVRDVYNRQIEEISNLQKQLKESSKELALLEGKMCKVEEYERERAGIISDRVNHLFSYVTVEMTTTDKKGDIVDTCRILDNKGIDYQVTNFASKVMSCIDISDAFCKFYGVSLPLIVDFAESISSNNLPKSNRQVIKLVVADSDFNVINE